MGRPASMSCMGLRPICADDAICDEQEHVREGAVRWVGRWVRAARGRHLREEARERVPRACACACAGRRRAHPGPAAAAAAAAAAAVVAVGRVDVHADGRVQVPPQRLQQVARGVLVVRPRHREELRRVWCGREGGGQCVRGAGTCGASTGGRACVTCATVSA